MSTAHPFPIGAFIVTHLELVHPRDGTQFYVFHEVGFSLIQEAFDYMDMIFQNYQALNVRLWFVDYSPKGDSIVRLLHKTEFVKKTAPLEQSLPAQSTHLINKD